MTEDLVYQIRNEGRTKNKQRVADPKTKVRYGKYGHCFVAGTMITTREEEIPIENVKAGDYILTREGYERITFSEVTGKNVVVKDYSIGNTNITYTPDHLFYTIEDDFAEIDKIIQKAFVTCEKTKKLSIRKSNERIIDKIYGITVEGWHEFFTNGILAHNCTDVLDYILCTFFSKS